MASHNITQPQLTLIHTLLSKNKLSEEKEILVSVHTGHRTKSSKEMTRFEASDLIKYLKSLEPKNDAGDKMRKKIISMAHEMGWELEGTKRIVGTQKQAKIDMAHVNDWCLKFGYLHKKLDDYTYEELPKLVSQFEGAYKAHLNKV
jgi:hypothetical protein